MIIDYSVKNYKSIKEEQGVSFVASNYDKTLPHHLMEKEIPGLKGVKLLKAVCLMGANASGKSIFLESFYALKSIITESFRNEDVLRERLTPFLLDDAYYNEPTEFYLRFIASNGTRYHYTFVAHRERILYEALSAYPKRAERVLFEREWDGEGYRFSSKLSSLNKIKSLIRDTSSVVSVAYASNNEEISPVFEWFKQGQSFVDAKQMTDDYDSRSHLSTYFYPHNPLNQVVKKIIQGADLGIRDIQLKEEEVARTSINRSSFFNVRESTGCVHIQCHHQGADDKLHFLDLSDESEGTRRFISLAGPIAEVLDQGKVCLIDELDSSLHPLLSEYVLKQFLTQDNQCSQLLFTTHDTHLLNTELMRRDQFFFAEKNEFGCTSITPLSDYTPRNKEALSAGYLAGRFGAIPQL